MISVHGLKEPIEGLPIIPNRVLKDQLNMALGARTHAANLDNSRFESTKS